MHRTQHITQHLSTVYHHIERSDYRRTKFLLFSVFLVFWRKKQNVKNDDNDDNSIININNDSNESHAIMQTKRSNVIGEREKERAKEPREISE